MSPQEQQMAALIEGKTEHRDVNVRSVDNGFILTAQRRWLDPATNIAVAQMQSETIAEDHSSAADRVANFLAYGAFVPTADAPSGELAN